MKIYFYRKEKYDFGLCNAETPLIEYSSANNTSVCMKKVLDSKKLQLRKKKFMKKFLANTVFVLRY